MEVRLLLDMIQINLMLETTPEEMFIDRDRMEQNNDQAA
jgi:hypothetical protein